MPELCDCLPQVVELLYERAVCGQFLQTRRAANIVVFSQRKHEKLISPLSIASPTRASCCSRVNVANQAEFLRTAGGGNVPQGTFQEVVVFIGFFMLYGLRFEFAVCLCLLTSSESTFSFPSGKIAFVAHSGVRSQTLIRDRNVWKTYRPGAKHDGWTCVA